MESAHGGRAVSPRSTDSAASLESSESFVHPDLASSRLAASQDAQETSTTGSKVVSPSAAGAALSPSGSGRMQQQPAQWSAIVTAASTGHASIVVDNVRFSLDLELLRSKPDTMLGRMFADGAAYSHPNEKGEHKILDGVSAAVFEAVLGYYSTGIIRIPVDVPLEEVREACDYLLIPFGASTIRTPNLRDLLHQLSNDGAQKRFEYFLDSLLLPKMAESARLGDRECHVVILAEEDAIDWDSHYPPPVGTEHTQTVFSTELCKFFKYAESRDVAKRLLKERGLKKIRLGIEGYPTHKEKVKHSRQPGQPPEVIYSYVQRPFVHVSWQKEESRSRHVDFQCVRSKPQQTTAASVADDLAGLLLEEQAVDLGAGAGPVAVEQSIRDASEDIMLQRQHNLPDLQYQQHHQAPHRRLQRNAAHGVRQGCSCSYCQLLQSPAASPERS